MSERLIRLRLDSDIAGQCPACGAPLAWYSTLQQRRMPMNPNAQPVRVEGGVGWFEETDVHPATCAAHGQLRKQSSWRRLLVMLVLVGLAPVGRASAQVTVEAQRFRLTTGPCVLSSGPGVPGSAFGNSCDLYVDTGGYLWMKIAGVWKKIGDVGSGTPGTLAKWATASTLMDSLLSESGSTITVNATLQSPTYASQVSGWQITPAGSADVRYLFTNELRAKIFTADSESVLAGSQRVTKSFSTIAQPFACPAAGATATLWVNDSPTFGDAPVFQTNDWILIHTLTRTTFGPFTIADCVGPVTNYVDGTGANAGQQSWTFTRGTGTNGGTMTAGTTVAVNQLAQDMGVSGSGYVETTAVDGANNANAPYTQIVTWTTAPTGSNVATRCRLGQLLGISGQSEYGLYCGTSSGQLIRLSDQNFEIRGTAIKMFDAYPTQTISLDPAGPSFALGNPMPTSYATGNGVWMGKDAGIYKFRVGNPAGGNVLTWDGTTLSVAGNGGGVTNINGGNIQTSTITASQIASGAVTTSKLSVGAGFGGAALNDDPGCTDASAWSPGTQITLVSDGKVGNYTCRLTPGTGTFSQRQIPVDANKTYRIHAWARGVTAQTGTSYLTVVMLDSGGANISGGGTYWWYPQSGVLPTTWVEWQGTFGANSGMPIPSNARNMLAGFLFNLGGAQSAEVQDLRIDEVLPGTLIQNGVITTNKIAAGAITATQIAAGSITAGQIAANTITAGNIATRSLTADRFVANTITSNEIGVRAIVAGNIQAGGITSTEIAANTITAGNIAANTITADRMSIGALSAMSANLGTVTSGTINSNTINSASINGSTISGTTVTAGCAQMNSNGLQIDPGTGSACNWYKFGGGSLGMYADGGAWMGLGGANIQLNGAGGAVVSVDNNISLRNSAGYEAKFNGSLIQFSTFGGMGGNHFVCADSSGVLYLASWNSSGTCYK